MRKSKFLVFFMLLIFITTYTVFADNLKLGSEGQAVVKLQTELQKLGFFKGKVTGYYGSETKTAVKRFQVQKGFMASGIVDSNLNKLLFRGTSSSVKTVATKKAPKAAPKAAPMAASARTFVAESAGTALLPGDPASKDMWDEPVLLSAAAVLQDKAEKPEVLDWWKAARNVFKVGTVATVIDVQTGKSFNIMRTYGANHADSETLTVKDTEIMKEIWGGSWSWDRRPVVLDIDGRLLAASMAGMPHAGLDELPANRTVSSRSGGFGRGANLDRIKDNGMSGHFDVHFLNSRTHGTDKVDPKHQAAIKEAAKAIIKNDTIVR